MGKTASFVSCTKTKDSRTKEVMLSLYQSRLSQHNTESWLQWVSNEMHCCRLSPAFCFTECLAESHTEPQMLWGWWVYQIFEVALQHWLICNTGTGQKKPTTYSLCKKKKKKKRRARKSALVPFTFGRGTRDTTVGHLTMVVSLIHSFVESKQYLSPITSGKWKGISYTQPGSPATS